MAKHLVRKTQLSKTYLVPAAVIFGFFGAVLLIRTFAATGEVVAFESEQGTFSGNVQLAQDTTASGGSYALFKPSASPTPAPGPSPTPPPTTGVNPVGLSGTFQLAWSDEFNGTTLDTAKWNNGGPFGDLCQGGEHWDPGQVSVSGGLLHLAYDRRATPLDDGCQHRIYNAGNVQTFNKYHPHSGQYIEFRFQPPKGKGLWSEIWMMPQSWISTACNNGNPWGIQSWEMDIMEYPGNLPDIAHSSIHYRTPQCTLEVEPGGNKTGTDWSLAMHTYGVDWYADHVDFYIDGSKHFTSTNIAGRDEPGFIMISGMLGNPGDTWADYPDGSTPNHAEILTDYVRIWDRK